MFSCCNLGTKEVRILMLGLDNAGKTTTLYMLKPNQPPVTTVPTVGFNVECYMQGNVKLNIWDIGGQDKIRPLWRHYYAGTKALIFVLDSHDPARLPEARLELHRILRDREMRGCPVLILANKQDLEGAMGEAEIIEGLGLTTTTTATTTSASIDASEILNGRPWRIQKACALEGKGLWEGLDWLVKSCKK